MEKLLHELMVELGEWKIGSPEYENAKNKYEEQITMLHDIFAKSEPQYTDTYEEIKLSTVLEKIIASQETSTMQEIAKLQEELLNQKKEDSVSALKKKIKHCKNPLERKVLERELNDLYKERKRKCRKQIVNS